MLSWFVNRWSKSRSFTSIELAVLRLFFPIGNEYAARLYLQATNAPYIERKLNGMSEYEAVIPYVVDDSMLIECDENVESPAIVITTSSGLVLTFSVTILHGGFLRGLKGRSPEGASWPKEWRANLQNAQIPVGIGTWIPQPISDEVRHQSLAQLFRWCGIFETRRDMPQGCDAVRIAARATDDLIRSCESRLRIRLNEQYLQLVAITNGFGIQRGRPYEFLGTTDIDFVNGAREWLCVTPLFEEGCVAIRCKDGFATNECFILSGDGESKHIGDLKQHIRESLMW